MNNYSEADQKILLDVARTAIRIGFENKIISNIKTELYTEALNEIRSSFVTLEINNQLRGCIGSLEARQPLIVDVAKNAYMAAFQDKRFNPLSQNELNFITISISVLTPAQEMHFDSEQDLLNKIRPGIDGIILKDLNKTATFLPSVWNNIKDKQLFLNNLKLKAGLSQDYWSDTIKVYNYQSVYITEK